MVDNDEAETDEETHAIPAVGRVAAEAAQIYPRFSVRECDKFDN